MDKIGYPQELDDKNYWNENLAGYKCLTWDSDGRCVAYTKRSVKPYPSGKWGYKNMRMRMLWENIPSLNGKFTGPWEKSRLIHPELRK